MLNNLEKIEELVNQELAEANKQHPLFHSWHEAYAVVLEEIDELQAELKRIEKYRERTWQLVKGDYGNLLHLCFERMHMHALWAAGEAIQVSAMCIKAMNSNLDSEEDKENRTE